MKKVIFSWLLSAMFISTAMAQFGATRTGFEGDNFSLEGAIELFKDSRSVQDFERRLNTKTNWVNNLDLDYNGRTDYIRVNHRRQGSLHAIILQVPVDRRYVQDIAVIQIEQTGRRRAVLQMVGDADLYGQNVVIEPYDNFNSNVNVYRWRVVQNILDGFGSPYASPYAFNNYPVWYNPWNQFAWNVYQPRISSWNRYYRVSPYNRLSNVYSIYSPYRTYCPTVRQRTARIVSQRPAVNRATVQRATSTTRTNRTTTPVTSRATTRQTQVTTSRATTPTRASRQTQVITRSNPSRATRQIQATTTKATTRANTSTRSTTTPVTRSTRPTVTRSTATRPTSAPRTSRATATTRATTQPRRTVTPSRTAPTVQRRTTAPTRTVTKRPTSKRSTNTTKKQ